MIVDDEAIPPDDLWPYVLDASIDVVDELADGSDAWPATEGVPKAPNGHHAPDLRILQGGRAIDAASFRAAAAKLATAERTLIERLLDGYVKPETIGELRDPKIAEPFARFVPGFGDLLDIAMVEHARRHPPKRRQGEAPAPIPVARWGVPLATFLGADEPDDDDATDWIIRDVVPRGEPAILAGPPKSGKTWAALDLAICVAMGLPWLGEQENTLGPARVLVVALEDHARRLRKRIWELCRGRGISPHDPLLLANLCISQAPFRLPGEKQLIAELAAWRPALVIVDNLTRIIAGDPNSTKDAAEFTNAWTRLGHDCGATVLLLHHLGKPSSNPRDQRDPFDAIRGSGDFVAAARNVIVTRPISAQDENGDAYEGAEQVSEFRIRGNLELKREAIAVALVKSTQADGRRVAKLVDRGYPSAIKAEVKERSKRVKGEAERVRIAGEFERRRELILDTIRRDGSATQSGVARALGVSDRSLRVVFQSLYDVIHLSDKRAGYVFREG